MVKKYRGKHHGNAQRSRYKTTRRLSDVRQGWNLALSRVHDISFPIGPPPGDTPLVSRGSDHHLGMDPGLACRAPTRDGSDPTRTTAVQFAPAQPRHRWAIDNGVHRHLHPKNKIGWVHLSQMWRPETTQAWSRLLPSVHAAPP